MKRWWIAGALLLLLLTGCQERRPIDRQEVQEVSSSQEVSQEEESSLPPQEEEPEESSQPEEKKQTGIPEGLTRSDWNLILVNAQHPLEEELPVELADVYGMQFDARAAEDLKAFIDAGQVAGFQVQMVDTYRSFAVSQYNLDRRIGQLMEEGCTEEEARAIAVKWIAPPGQSEHNTGLALDVVSVEYRQANALLDHNFEEDPLFQWLIDNCADYGFVLRYPKDKEEITGITYEPWHYRYVGREAARYIMDNQLCLEEFWEMLPEE